MSFYDDPENAEKYIEMAEGFDGSNLIEILKTPPATGQVGP